MQLRKLLHKIRLNIVVVVMEQEMAVAILVKRLEKPTGGFNVYL